MRFKYVKWFSCSKFSSKNFYKYNLILVLKVILSGTVLTACAQQVDELKEISKNLTSSVSNKTSSFVEKSTGLMQGVTKFANDVKDNNKIKDIESISKDLFSILEKIPDEYNGAKGYSIDLTEGIWGSVTQAVKSNEGYQAAILLEDEAMSEIGVAKSVRRTQFTGQSTIGGIYESGGSNNDDTKGVGGNFNITKLLYDGGRSLSNINQASAYALALQAARKGLGNKTAFDAASTWINIWYMTERLDLMNARSKKLNALIEKMDRMASSGMIDMSVIDSSKAQLVEIKLEKNTLEANFDANKVRFLRYFDQEPSNLSRPSFLISLENAELEINNWRKSPSLEESVAKLIVARNEVESAKSAFKPSATARAGISSPMKDGESTDKTVGVRLEYTFGDGGRREAKLSAANAKLKSTEVQLKETQLMLQTELNSSLVELNALNSSLSLYKDKIKLNYASVKTAESQLNTGQSTLKVLIKAEIDSFNSNNKYLIMQAEQHKLLLKVISLNGTIGRNLNF